MGLMKNYFGITNCVAKNIDNCLISTNVYPFSCSVCNTGYYPNKAGICE